MHKACIVYYLCLCILLVTLIQTSCLKRKNIYSLFFILNLSSAVRSGLTVCGQSPAVVSGMAQQTQR